jgi:uncharacterized membrane protein YccC
VQFWKLIASDPGLLRLKSALRVVLTLLLTIVVLVVVVLKAMGRPFPVIFPGVVVAMIASLAISEPNIKQRKVSMLLVPLPAAAAITLAALFAGNLVVSDVVFLAVIFLAVLARWFGPRGLAYGLVAFIVYFLTVFIRLQPGQLPIVYLVLVIAMVCAYAMKFWLMRDKPEKALPAAVRSFRLQAALLLDACAEVPAGGQATKRGQSSLDKRAARLNTVTLTLEAQLEQIEPERFSSKDYYEDLSFAVFDMELEAEQIATIWRRGGDITAEEAEEFQRQFRGVSDLLRSNRHSEKTLEKLEEDTSNSARGNAIDTSLQEIARLSERLRELNVREEVRNLNAAPEASAAASAAAERPPFAPILKAAVQTVLATGLALLFGTLLSNVRWYWAVIAAFVTFTGTSSRGETVYKGWQRVLGTIGGVILGAVIATFVGGNKLLDGGIAIACVFLAFYSLQIAYSLMIFWITTMLALLYGLLGEFSVGLLDLRLEETLIGAAVGAVVAFFVFPVHTEIAVRKSIAHGLRDLHDVVKGVTNRQMSRRQLADETRDLDKTLRTLRKTARPLTSSPWSGRRQTDGGAAQQVRYLSFAAYYSRQLSRRRINWEDTPKDLHRPILRVSSALQHNITQLAKHIEGNPPEKFNLRQVDKRIDELDNALAPYRAKSAEDQPTHFRYLESYSRIARRLDQILTNLQNAR